MSKPPVKIKRLSDLRTAVVRSGNGAKFPHQTYMRLCCLEMERFRREQERAAAMGRADKCTARCRQIEVEVRQLLVSIGQVLATDPTEPQPDTDVSVSLPAPQRSVQSAKMTFNY